MINLCFVNGINSVSDYTFISTGYKNKLMLMGGYTFAQMHSQKHWYCSQKRKGCKAKVKLNEDGILVSALTEHCHNPPQIHVTNSGHYLVLRNVDRH